MLRISALVRVWYLIYWTLLTGTLSCVTLKLCDNMRILQQPAGAGKMSKIKINPVIFLAPRWAMLNISMRIFPWKKFDNSGIGWAPPLQCNCLATAELTTDEIFPVMRTWCWFCLFLSLTINYHIGIIVWGSHILNTFCNKLNILNFFLR